MLLVAILKPHRRCVGYEVNVVIAAGKFKAKLSAHHAAAAVGWETGYSNIHKLMATGLAISAGLDIVLFGGAITVTSDQSRVHSHWSAQQCYRVGHIQGLSNNQGLPMFDSD